MNEYLPYADVTTRPRSSGFASRAPGKASVTFFNSSAWLTWNGTYGWV